MYQHDGMSLPNSDVSLLFEVIQLTIHTSLSRRFSDEIVIVEVPTRDGIEHEDDDITFLYSKCVPRTAVYAVFPILVLVFILGCAFI